MEKQEIYKQIPKTKYSDYWVSNYGNVKSYKRNEEIIMKTCLRNGYKSLTLCTDNKKKNFLVHRLVALTFLDNPDNLLIVNHIDGNILNDNVTNLEWVTYSQNTQHSQKILGKIRSGVAVHQFNLDGTYIATFNSIKEAAFANNMGDSHIPSVCRGKRNSAGGFIWKYVKDYKLENEPEGETFENFTNYIITKTGQIYSRYLRSYMVLTQLNSGYLKVKLSLDGITYDFYVHVLVGLVYLPKIPGKIQINHKDRNKSNDNIDNLEWVSPSENMEHARKTGINTNSKPVVKCNIQGDEIKIYEKIADAAKDCNVDPSSIVKCCKGKQRWTGKDNQRYIWKYA